MNKVYLVKGETGDEQCYQTWLYGCFSNREAAFSHKKKVQSYFDNLWETYYHDYFTLEKLPTLNKVDLNIKVGYGGVRYKVEEVEVKEI